MQISESQLREMLSKLPNAKHYRDDEYRFVILEEPYIFPLSNPVPEEVKVRELIFRKNYKLEEWCLIINDINI